MSSNSRSVISFSIDIITIAINNQVLTRKIVTWSIKQHSANCKEQDECGAQPCLDPGKGEMRERMVGDKSTSANSMGHFSKDLEHCLSACHDREMQRSKEFDNYKLIKD